MVMANNNPSGHLAILQNFLRIGDLENQMLFDVLLHLGTLGAVIVAYHTELRGLCREGLMMLHIKKPKRGARQDPPRRRLLLFLIVATLPLIPAAFLSDYLDALFYDTFFIGFALIGDGRGNAIRTLALILLALQQQGAVELADFHGGKAHNAIPEAAAATFATDIEAADLLATLDPEEYKGEDEEEKGGQQETRQPTVPPRTTDVYLYLFHFRPLTVVLHGIAEDVAACIEIAEGDQVADIGEIGSHGVGRVVLLQFEIPGIGPCQ